MIRRLRLDEWGRLKEFPDDIVPDSDKAIAIVSEGNSGKLDGRVFIVSPVHLEALYIDPTRRSTALLSRLVERAEKEAKAIGLSKLYAYGDGPVMESYISRLKYERERWSVWRKDLI